MLVMVGDVCRTCKFYSGEWTETCNYSVITGHSRLFESGKRVVEKGFCNKYEEGRIEYDATKWKNRGRILRNG